jgi:hypothetical protein
MPYIYPITKNNQITYRVYYPYYKKKIYLGLYKDLASATHAYDYVDQIMHSQKNLATCVQTSKAFISFHKLIILLNYRDTKLYFNKPIYLDGYFFSYYLDENTKLIFDKEDLFFFSTHTLGKRGGYLYVENGISQTSLLSRFGIPNYSKVGKDYFFKNENPLDFRRENLIVNNTFIGVSKEIKYKKEVYVARITLKNTLIIGYYETATQAAIAYNKAAMLLMDKNPKKQYTLNTLDYLTASEYSQIYESVAVSPRLFTTASQKKILPPKLSLSGDKDEITYRGVSSDKGSFRAFIGYASKQIYLGSYPTKERAAQAYNFASFYLYGNKGYVNPTSPLIHSNDEKYIAKKLEKAQRLKS